MIRILENLFTDFDWQELKSDLENWPTNQLEIFTHCILTGEGSHGEMTVGNRIELLPTLLNISKNRGQNTNDIQY